MKVKLLIILCCLAGYSCAVVTYNPEDENLYLGNDNVSCGRYTLVDNSPLISVRSYCTIVQETDNPNGVVQLRIQTDEDGVVDCRFINGTLDECFVDD